MDKTVIVDHSFDAYKPFFDSEWAESIGSQVEGTELARAFSDLCVSWRGAEHAHTLPWIVMRTFGVFNEAMQKLTKHYISHMGGLMATLLEEEMGDRLRHMQRKRLKEAVAKLDTGLRATLDDKQFGIDINSQWQSYLKNSEFQLSLWASQRLCYAAVYYAYEDFLIRCMKLATGKQQCRTQDKEFKPDFKTHFGGDLLEDCWLHSKVHVARLVRHAIAHAGGRVTQDLKAVKHGLETHDDELQIMPDDTVALHRLLKERAEKMAIKTLELLKARGQQANG